MCTPLPESSSVHRAVVEVARAVSDHLTPQTTAYHEIWLSTEDGRKKVAGTTDVEPIYGGTYLPRKFKMSFAIPPRNDVDVFAHDLSFVAISDSSGLTGFNVTVGGGMGASHGDPATYPRLADVLGFCSVEQVIEVSEAIVMIQRDNGDRTDRKHARLKYTIDDHGLDWLHDNWRRRPAIVWPPPGRLNSPTTVTCMGGRKRMMVCGILACLSRMAGSKTAGPGSI